MMLEYDPAADAAYVEFSDRPIDRTGQFDQDRIVDYDAEDGIVGYDFLNVSRGVDLSDLPHQDELARLFADRNIRIFV